MGRKLTAKQQAFVDNYIITLNATEAAKRAGYNCKDDMNYGMVGNENLKKPKIRAAIDKRMASKQDKLIADQDEILRFYTGVMRDAEVHTKHRKSAADSLAKTYGMFIDRKDIDVKGAKLEDFFGE
jgi:phage terminase small subunit